MIKSQHYCSGVTVSKLVRKKCIRTYKYEMVSDWAGLIVAVLASCILPLRFQHSPNASTVAFVDTLLELYAAGCGTV